ncbi:retrovirus-related pol polyprotein from transposon TNT 1-94 [Tanacetum coccineum]
MDRGRLFVIAHGEYFQGTQLFGPTDGANLLVQKACRGKCEPGSLNGVDQEVGYGDDLSVTLVRLSSPAICCIGPGPICAYYELSPGLVRKYDLYSLNVPLYYAYVDEIRDIIHNQGSVSLDILETFEINLDPYDTDYENMNVSDDLIMSGDIPPIPPPFGASSGNPGSPNANRVDTIPTTTDPINTTTTTNCKTAKEMWNDIILAHEGPSDARDTKIAALRLKFNAFKSLEGEKVMGTFTRLKCLLNDLENNGVTIPKQNLATLYGKYNYEEGLIDQIYKSEIQRFSIQTPSSKALISNTQFQDSESDVEEDQRTNNEFMADLNAEYHKRALLVNQKRFYKRSGRVGSARKPIDKTKETCFTCGKTGHFQKDCPLNKTSTPSYPSSNNSFNKFKSYTPPINQTSSHNTGNYKKDYKEKYKGLKAEMVVLTQRIDDLTKGKSEKGKIEKGKSEKGLIAESFD